MMRESLRFLASPVRGLQAAVYILAASALLSSLLALVRDRLFAHNFGAGLELDLYYAAFRIPDLLFVALGALVSVYILIPELARRSREEEKAYIDTVIVGFSVLGLVLSALAAAAAPQLLSTLFPEFTVRELPTVVLLTRIMLLQPILLGLSNILAAITQARQRYLLYSISPILYNLGIIAGLLFFYPYLGLPGLAWGVVLGAMLHVAVQIPSVVSDGFFRSFPLLRDMRALLETMSLSVPRALALTMNQITFIGLMAIASSLVPGSIAVFVLAFNLMSVPLAVIGASYSVAAFPTLASALSLGRTAEFIEYVATAARYIIFWSLPTIALIIVLRAHIVRVILGSGAFDWTDTRLTAAVFAILALSLLAQGLMLLLARAYYAAGRTFVPFFVALGSAVLTILLALSFTDLFQQTNIQGVAQSMLRLEDVAGSTVVALGFAYALVSIVATIVLMVHFEWRFGGLFSRISTSAWQAALAAIGAGAAAHTILVIVGPLTLSSTLLSVLLRGLAGGVGGIFAAMLIFHILSNREYGETLASLRGSLWRVPLTGAQPIASAEEISSSSPQ